MKKLYALAVAVFFIAFSGNAQFYKIGEATLVNGNEDYPAPYGNYYWGAKHQMIYKASELKAKGATAGDIVSLAFIIDTIYSGVPLNNFRIRIGETKDTLFSSKIFYADLDTVYSNSPYTPFKGINSYIFDSAFYWNGDSSIIVEVLTNNVGYTLNEGTQYTSYSNTMTAYLEEDQLEIDTLDVGISLSKLRPNIVFQFRESDDLAATYVSQYNSQCDFGGKNDISISIKNVGSNSQETFMVSYQINSEPPITETVNHNVAKDENYTYTFSKKADFSKSGDYMVKAWVTVGADANTANDTVGSDVFTNILSPDVSDTTICKDKSVTLTSLSDYDTLYWYDSELAETPFAKGSAYTTPELGATTTYFVEGKNREKNLWVDTVLNNGDFYKGNSTSSVLDVGFTVTQKYVYIGDTDSILRLDAYDLSNMKLIDRDGKYALISDLSTSKLYSFYDTTNGGGHIRYNLTPLWKFTINSLVELNDTLAIDSSSVLLLSDSIQVNTSARLFSGQGYVLVYLDDSTSWYHIDLNKGDVEKLGKLKINMNGFYGWTESLNDTLYVTYKDKSDTSFSKTNLSTGETKIFASFNYLGGNISITYSPWLNRMYWHSSEYTTIGGGYDRLSTGYLNGVSNVTQSFGCRTEVTVSVVDTCANTAIHVLDGESAVVNMYPNPSKGTLNVAYNAVGADVIDIRVYNLVGKTIGAYQIFTAGSNGVETIDISNFEKGLYYVSVNFGDTVMTQKVLLQ